MVSWCKPGSFQKGANTSAVNTNKYTTLWILVARFRIKRVQKGRKPDQLKAFVCIDLCDPLASLVQSSRKSILPPYSCQRIKVMAQYRLLNIYGIIKKLAGDFWFSVTGLFGGERGGSIPCHFDWDVWWSKWDITNFLEPGCRVGTDIAIWFYKLSYGRFQHPIFIGG